MTALTGAAAIGDGAGGFVIDAVEVRDPGAGEVRVRLRAAGICHTDHASLHWAGPLVLGHEGAGVVDSVGPGVDVSHPGLQPGQPVLPGFQRGAGRPAAARCVHPGLRRDDRRRSGAEQCAGASRRQRGRGRLRRCRPRRGAGCAAGRRWPHHD